MATSESEREKRDGAAAAAGGMSGRLPDKLVGENILWRLPTKSILRCRCVCKSWRSLVTSSKFVSTHLRNHSKEKEFIFVVKIFVNIARGSKFFLLNNLAEDYFHPSMSLHLPYGLHNQTSLFVLGSVKGLICVSIGDGSQYHILNLILFNPSIGHFLSIPPPDSSFPWVVKGFGFDETNQDYKILLIPSSGLEFDQTPSDDYVASRPAFVYSLNSNSWRSLVISPPPFRCRGSVVFVNGGLHWFGYHQQPLLSPPCIWVFDVKSETFRQISLPKCLLPTCHVLKLMEFGDDSDSSSLAISSPTLKDTNDIWLMKDYALGDESSWIKLATVDSIQVLGFVDNDHLLMQLYHARKLKDLSACLVSHDIKEKLNKRLIYPDYTATPGYRFTRVHKYVPSLVLLDKPNNIDATFVHVTTPSPPRSHQVEEVQLRRSKRTRKSPPSTFV